MKKDNFKHNIVVSDVLEQNETLQSLYMARKAPCLFLLRNIAAMLMLSGMILLIFSLFPSIQLNVWVALAILLPLCCGLNILLAGKWRSIGILFICILASLLLIIGLNTDPNSIGALKNDFADRLTELTGHIHLRYVDIDEFRSIPLLLCAGLIVSLILCLLLLSKRDYPLLLFSGIILTCSLAGIFSSSSGAFLLFTGVLLAAVLRCSQLGGYAVPKESSKSFLGLLSALSITAFAVVLCLPFTNMGTAAICENAFTLLHKIKYDSSTASMPEGKLKDLNGWKNSSTPALSIKSSEALAAERLYFRGMVGEIYTGHGWTSLDNASLSKQYGLFYWLHENGFYGQVTSAEAASALEAAGALDYSERSMEITNISACKRYMYLPYQAIKGNYLDDTLIGDAIVFADKYNLPKNESSVLSIALCPEASNRFALQSKTADAQEQLSVKLYLSCERAYAEFVYENYLQLTPEVRSIFAELFGDSPDAMTLTQITEKIMAALETELTYNEAANTPCGDNDFIAYVLELGKSGYSVHYATCAAMMLRYFGVPARYVEGYLLTEKQARNYVAGNALVLTENDAHAWAEYYLDGIGWVPFDITPGYIDKSELPIMNAGETAPDDAPGEEQQYQNDNLSIVPLVRPNRPDNKHPANYFWLIAIILLSFLMLAFTFRTVFFRLRLRKRLRQMKEADNNEAITLRYGYCTMLIERTKSNFIIIPEEIHNINLEAIFSNHIMNESKRTAMAEFMRTVIRECKQRRNFIKRLYDRFIACLYI